jgi:hypothetical protein
VRQFGWLRALMPASSGAPPVKMKAPKEAAVFDDPSGVVDLARFGTGSDTPVRWRASHGG